MVKEKQKVLAAKCMNKKGSSSGRVSKSNHEVTLEVGGAEEEGWVMVKKQRITVLIPPLPGAEKSTVLRSCSGQSQASPKGTAEFQPAVPVQEIPNLQSVDDHGKSTPLVVNNSLEINKQHVAGHMTTLPGSQRMNVSVKMQKMDCIRPEEMEVTFKRLNQNPTTSGNMDITIKTAKQNHVGSKKMDFTIREVKPNYVATSKCNAAHWLSRTDESTQRLLINDLGVLNTGNSLLTRKMRLSYLEKRLQQAGGLSGWLLSLGLGQFVRIFQARNISKHQLVNLTMKKLKDMGATAVGPRRKLLHAIDCGCLPTF